MITINWKSHCLCGIVTGYALTNSWQGAVVGGVAALVPDIDMPHSRMGRALPFLSHPINHLFGHRTLTHSLLFIAIIWYLLVGHVTSDVLTGIIGGLLVHVVGDMVTGRVKLFYPLPLFIGIRVSRKQYHWIDRFTQVVLEIFIGIFLFEKIFLVG